MGGGGRRGRASLAVLWVVVCVGCVTPRAQSPTERELLRRIETSGTVQDHAALAAYYREQAQLVADKAAFHQVRARRTIRIPRGGGRANAIVHRNLAASYRRLLAEYERLAELHEGHARALRGEP